MTKAPSFQFYPADWRKDPGVQSLDYFDRGVWFEMLCLMHESEQRGRLMLNGQPTPDTALATMLGLPLRKLRTTIARLLERGVASRDEQGTLISRRMVRDEQLRQVRAAGGNSGAEFGHLGAEYGKRGGRPPKTPQRTPHEKPHHHDGKPPSKPAPSSSSSSSDTPPTPSGGSGGDLFATFWGSYPRKIAKQDALKAWKRLKPDGSLLAGMLAALEAQKRSADWLKDGGEFIPYPAKWLRARRWKDEVGTPAGEPEPKESSRLELVRGEDGKLYGKKQEPNGGGKDAEPEASAAPFVGGPGHAQPPSPLRGSGVQ